HFLALDVRAICHFKRFLLTRQHATLAVTQLFAALELSLPRYAIHPRAVLAEYSLDFSRTRVFADAGPATAIAGDQEKAWHCYDSVQVDVRNKDGWRQRTSTPCDPEAG